MLIFEIQTTNWHFTFAIHGNIIDVSEAWFEKIDFFSIIKTFPIIKNRKKYSVRNFWL